jgi:multidrug resistance efflux pump
MITGIIEISSPGYQAKGETGFWSANRYARPHALENTIPIARRDIDKQQDAINTLRTKIKEAKQEQRAPSEARREGGITAELERLAALKEQGALTDEEFVRANECLLS